MLPAILVKDKVVTGSHHGDAFSKLNEEEKNEEVISGFVDYEHNKFITDDGIIYLKDIIIVRHAQSDLRIEDGPITSSGRSQAFKVAKFLKEFCLNDYHGFCSPFLRCKQTSVIIKEICSVHFDTDLHLCKQTSCEEQQDFSNRIIETLDSLPPKSILITHTDFIQNILFITNIMKEKLQSISNCSITYIHQNRIIWLAKDINVKEN
jgi:broad specificity phosphatase PhoE